MTSLKRALLDAGATRCKKCGKWLLKDKTHNCNKKRRNTRRAK